MGGLGVRTPSHNPPAQTRIWKAETFPGAHRHLHCHPNFLTPESKPTLFRSPFTGKLCGISPSTHTPSSGLTCVAACGVKGVCVRGSVCGRVCESMLQDSGTPSLFAPLSASAEPLSASLEEPLGPKANYPRTRPLWRHRRYQSAFGGGGGWLEEGWGLGWSWPVSLKVHGQRKVKGG